MAYRNRSFDLYSLAARLKRPATILEIGSWKGKSTACLASGLRRGRVIAIDSFDASGEAGSSEIYAATKGDGSLLEEFKRNVSVAGVQEKITIWHGRSEDFANRDITLDLLFIDGDHSIEGCKADYLNFHPKLRVNGLLAFHDYDPARPELGPTWVVNNFLGASSPYDFLGVYDSIWVGRKQR